MKSCKWKIHMRKTITHNEIERNICVLMWNLKSIRIKTKTSTTGQTEQYTKRNEPNITTSIDKKMNVKTKSKWKQQWQKNSKQESMKWMWKTCPKLSTLFIALQRHKTISCEGRWCNSIQRKWTKSKQKQWVFELSIERQRHQNLCWMFFKS